MGGFVGDSYWIVDSSILLGDSYSVVEWPLEVGETAFTKHVTLLHLISIRSRWWYAGWPAISLYFIPSTWKLMGCSCWVSLCATCIMMVPKPLRTKASLYWTPVLPSWGTLLLPVFLGTSTWNTIGLAHSSLLPNLSWPPNQVHLCHII